MLSKKVVLMLSALAVAGCETPETKPVSTGDGSLIGSSDITDINGVDTIDVSDGYDSGVDTQGGTETFGLVDCEPDCEYSRSALNDPNSLLANRLIFFPYDSGAIDGKYSDILIAHGKYLANNPGVKVRLEGHTDERGTREYNLALSEKRAQSVRRFLMLYGAREENIGVHGFGEELPLALGSNETAWAENRRVELVYDAHR